MQRGLSVCGSACPSAGHERGLNNIGRTDRGAVWDVESKLGWIQTYVLGGGPDPPGNQKIIFFWGGDIFIHV